MMDDREGEKSEAENVMEEKLREIERESERRREIWLAL